MPAQKEICPCCGKSLCRKTILAHSRGGGLQIHRAQLAQLHHGILPAQSTAQPRPPVTTAEPPRKRRRGYRSLSASVPADLAGPSTSQLSTPPETADLSTDMNGGHTQHNEEDIEYVRETRRRVTVEDVTDVEDGGLSERDSSDSDFESDSRGEDDDWMSAAEWMNVDFEKSLEDCGALLNILNWQVAFASVFRPDAHDFLA